MANNKIKYTDEYLDNMLSVENYKYISKLKKNDKTYVNSICPKCGQSQDWSWFGKYNKNID